MSAKWKEPKYSENASRLRGFGENNVVGAGGGI